MPEINEYTEVVRAHHSGLRYFIRSLGVQSAWVDDIAQEAFLLAYKKWDELDEAGNAGAWLRTIARNLVMNELSKTHRRQRLIDENLTTLLLDAEPDAERPGRRHLFRRFHRCQRASDFLVLDGLIEVSRGKETRRVTEGQAVRTAESIGIKDLDFEPTPFSRTWPLASGILSTKGSVVPASPGTPEQLSKLESDDTVMVIPEKRNVIFDQSIEAEIIAPGSFSAKNAKQLHHLPADPEMRLRGFLIRYNPKWSTDFRRFDGEVTFDRPVMAICCQGKYLDATDDAFANGVYTDVNEKARAFRGIDLDQPSKFPEVVTLSEDRRTVKILFNAGISSDDIRVILEEN